MSKQQKEYTVAELRKEYCEKWWVEFEKCNECNNCILQDRSSGKMKVFCL